MKRMLLGIYLMAAAIFVLLLGVHGILPVGVGWGAFLLALLSALCVLGAYSGTEHNQKDNPEKGE